MKTVEMGNITTPPKSKQIMNVGEALGSISQPRVSIPE